MAYFTLNLLAGVAQQIDVPGSIILIDSVGLSDGVDVTPVYRGGEQKTMPRRQAAFKYVTQYDGVKFEASVDAKISVFLTSNEVSLGFANGASVNVLGSVAITNGPGNRVPVDISGGTVNVTAGAVTVGNTNAAAVPVKQQALAVIVDNVVASIGTGAAQLLISDVTYRRLRVRNASLTAVVSLGGAAVTAANACIVLLPGETFFEDDAAGAAWYAVSDTVATEVRVMGLK